MSKNGHFEIEVLSGDGRWYVAIRPLSYSSSSTQDLTALEADILARELNDAAHKARGLNNPPRPFYK
jgi:hypothetical protein